MMTIFCFQNLEETEESLGLLCDTHAIVAGGSLLANASHSPAVSAEGDGLALHAEHVPGGVLGVLPAHVAGAAGLEGDPGQGGVRGGAHVATSGLASTIGVNRHGQADEEDDGKVHHVASVRSDELPHMWLPAVWQALS